MNIYVSNLSFEIDNSDLQSLFEEFGEVASASIITDKFTRRSRGFGFVEMPQKEQAEEAIKELNGREYKGRAIAATEAREREERTSNNSYRGGNSGYGRR